MAPSPRIVRAAVLATLLSAPVAEAGWYAQPAARWVSISHRPEAAEPTPNYYGYGALFSTGYSAKQVFDLGLYGAYSQASHKTAKATDGEVELTNLGGEMALRLGESVYVGFRVGQGSYNLLKRTRDEELPGRWTGPAGELVIGGVSKLTKSSFMQLTLDVMHGVYEGEDAEIGKRRFDGVAISLSYVYNHYKSYLIDNKIFGAFLDSLMF